MNRIAGISESVVSELRFASDLDQAAAPEVGEMPRDQRLWKLEEIDQIADAQLAGGEHAQDS